MISTIKNLVMMFIILFSAALVTGCDGNKTKDQIIDELNGFNEQDGGVNGNLPRPFPDIVTYLNQITNPPLADCACDTQSSTSSADARISGIVLNSSGQPIEGAEVRVLKRYVITSADGKYSLDGISSNQSVVVNFFHSEFMTTSRILFAAANSENFIEQKMKKIDHKKLVNNGDEISLLASSGAQVLTNWGAQFQKDGQYYQGKVEAALTYLNLKDTDSIMKFLGKYKGKDFNGQDIPFVSYGMINFELKDEQALKVDLAEGEVATLTFPANAKADGKDTISLFSYDYHQGTWKEEGSAVRQEDGSFKGDVTHTGVWSLNSPVDLADGTEYHQRIVHPDGSPFSNVEVMAIGRSGWMSKDVATDADGNFQLKGMIPNEPFRLKAYNKEGHHYADYQYEINGLEAGEIRVDQK